MAIKAKHKARFNSLNSIIIGMKSAGVNIDAVEKGLEKEISSLEKETGLIIKINPNETGEPIVIIDKSKDFIRIRNSNPENKVLRAKVLGIQIEIKTFKKDEFQHSNAEISEAIKELASLIENSDKEFSLMEPMDIDTSNHLASVDILSDLNDGDLNENDNDDNDNDDKSDSHLDEEVDGTEQELNGNSYPN